MGTNSSLGTVSVDSGSDHERRVSAVNTKRLLINRCVVNLIKTSASCRIEFFDHDADGIGSASGPIDAGCDHNGISRLQIVVGF